MELSYSKYSESLYFVSRALSVMEIREKEIFYWNSIYRLIRFDEIVIHQVFIDSFSDTLKNFNRRNVGLWNVYIDLPIVFVKACASSTKC